MTAAVVSIFDKGDGTGADWRLMTESLFQAAFVMLNGLPEDARRSIARRVHEGSYRRMLPGPLNDDSAASNSGPAGSVSTPSITAGLKSLDQNPGKPA